MTDMQKVLCAIEEKDNAAQVRHKELSEKIDAFSQKFENLDRKIEEVDIKTSFLTEDLHKVKGEVNYIQQRALVNNIIIKGVPEVQSETVDKSYSIVCAIMQKLDIVVDRIGSVRRMGRAMDGRPRFLQVSMVNAEAKTEVIEKKRKTNLLLEQIELDGVALGDQKQPIYIDEQLTFYSNSLLKQLIALKKDQTVKFVWTKNGIIYVRQNDKGEPIPIRNQLDIDQCKKNFKKRSRETETNGDGGSVQIAKAARRVALARTTKQGSSTQL